MATVPSIGELNSLRRDYEPFLVDRCTIYRMPAPTAVDRGQAPDVEYPAGWDVVASAQKCRLVTQVRKAGEGLVAGQVQSNKDGKLLLKFDVVDVLAGDRIRITTRSPLKTFDLEVAGSLNRSDKLKTSIDVVKVT
jgi:hypothetical protein